MKNLFKKFSLFALGGVLALGVGVSLIAGNSTGEVSAADSKTLVFDLSKNPGGWPTTNTDTLANYKYKLDGTNYTFGLKNVKCNSGYLMLTSTAALGLPAIEQYKLTKIVAKNSSGCSTTTKVGVSSSDSAASYISGGAAKTWSTTSSKYTYELTGTIEDTMYFMYVTNKNAQIIELELTYEYSSTRTLDSVSIKTAPKKTKYLVGDYFDPTGLVVDVEYEDGGKKSVEYDEDSATKFGFYPSLTTPLALTHTSVTVSYRGVVASKGQEILVIEAVSYTLTMYPNHDSLDPSVASAVAIPENPFTYDLHLFLEWNSEPNGKGKTFDVGTTLDGDTTIYAIWAKNESTEASPYTVEEAMIAIDKNYKLADQYVTGIVCQVDSYNSTYHSITYWISTDGSTTNMLEVYSGKGLGGSDFSSKDDIALKAKVIVFGTLKKFNTIYEFNQNNKLVSYVPQTLTQITVKTAPNKLEYYVGEDFDPAGLVITATTSGGTTEDVAYKDHESDFSFEPSTFNTAGNVDVTITYKEKTCTQAVSVKNRTLVSLAISGDMDKKAYALNDNWDVSGLVVTATYDNTDTEVVTEDVESWTFNPEKANSLEISQLSVSATIGNISSPSVTINGVSVHLKVHTKKSAEETWDIVSDISTLAPGDVVIFTGEKDGVNYAMGTYQSGNNIKAATSTLTIQDESQVTSGITDDMIYTLEAGTVTGSVVFKDSTGKYIYAASPSNNYMKSQGFIDKNASFTLMSNGTVKATESTNRNCIRYNNGGDSNLFSCYGETATTGKLVRFFKKSGGVIENDLFASYILVEDVNEAEGKISCGVKEVTTAEWAQIEAIFNDIEVTSDDWTILKYGVAVAEHDDQGKLTGKGNLIEHFLSRYDYIVAKYQYKNFLERNVNPVAVGVNPINESSSMQNPTVLIAVIVATGVFAVSLCGYVIIKKRRFSR